MAKGKIPRRGSAANLRKDIFVDDCVAVRLENPIDPKLRTFLAWLAAKGVLVITPKIVAEYKDSLSRGGSSTFIALLAILQKEKRQVFISNEQLKAFRIPKRIERSLRSNRKDWPHIKAVIISDRRMALSFDLNFVADVNSYPGVRAIASNDAERLAYQ